MTGDELVRRLIGEGLSEEEARANGIYIVRTNANPEIDAATFTFGSTMIYEKLMDAFIQGELDEIEDPEPFVTVGLFLDGETNLIHVASVIDNDNGNIVLRSKITGSSYIIDHGPYQAPVEGAYSWIWVLIPG